MNKSKSIIIIGILLATVLVQSFAQKEKRKIPEKSMVTIDGVGGCLYPIEYRLLIFQSTNRVSAIQILDETKTNYYQISYDQYSSFLETFRLRENKLDESYGKMHTTADFLGSFVVQYTTETGVHKKEIGYCQGKLEDKEFRPLLDMISSLTTESNMCEKVDINNWINTQPTSGWTLPGTTPVD